MAGEWCKSRAQAAKFTHEGSITVNAHIGADGAHVGAVLVLLAAREPPLVKIAVSDTGIGMSEEGLGRVFEEI